ncbi:MAG: hypothetical protein KDD58_15855, partial [Bdellovibrionales bacterium]|nr:hypothetical protein [Bdellovibrionales bacterium]
ESNELKPDSFIEGFHLPIFTFKLCEENKFSKDNSVCLELGYLSEVDVWSDVVWATLLSKLGYEYNVQDNLKRISLDKEKQRWKTAKLYATWYENGNVTTFLENENGEFKVADIIFGMLNVDSGHNYMGTSKIEAEVINKDIHFSTNKDLYIKSLLYEKGCVKF